MICPVCNNESDDINICNYCQWKFVYYTDTIADLEKEKQLERINQYKSIFLKKIIESDAAFTKLTVKHLKKDQFQTSKEHNQEIKDLGFVDIGIVTLTKYDADRELIYFNCDIDQALLKSDFYFDYNFGGLIFTIDIKPNDAKVIFNEPNTYVMLARIDLKDKKMKFLDIKFLNFSFFDKLAYIFYKKQFIDFSDELINITEDAVEKNWIKIQGWWKK